MVYIFYYSEKSCLDCGHSWYISSRILNVALVRHAVKMPIVVRSHSLQPFNSKNNMPSKVQRNSVYTFSNLRK